MATVPINALASRIRAIVAEYSKLPDPILRVQCASIGKNTDDIVESDLPVLATKIGAAVAMFTNPAKGAAAQERVLGLKRK